MLAYLSRHTHRMAIANCRLSTIDNALGERFGVAEELGKPGEVLEEDVHGLEKPGVRECRKFCV